MADDRQRRALKDPFKVGAVVGILVAVVGGIVLDLDWPAYFVLLAVVAVVGGIVVAARERGGDASRVP